MYLPVTGNGPGLDAGGVMAPNFRHDIREAKRSARLAAIYARIARELASMAEAPSGAGGR